MLIEGKEDMTEVPPVTLVDEVVGTPLLDESLVPDIT
jgi:hypothetical protein